MTMFIDVTDRFQAEEISVNSTYGWTAFVGDGDNGPHEVALTISAAGNAAGADELVFWWVTDHDAVYAVITKTEDEFEEFIKNNCETSDE